MTSFNCHSKDLIDKINNISRDINNTNIKLNNEKQKVTSVIGKTNNSIDNLDLSIKIFKDNIKRIR